MEMDKIKWYFLLPIIVISLFTRLYRLNTVPPHLSNDEISIAYDAYSIIRTARDEHSHFMPLAFESHGTYKAPLYIYLLSPLTLVLPNSSATARLPSAIAGCLTVLFIIFLATELTKSYKLGLLSGFVLAITPWHIYTSRMALEANMALFFLTLGLWLIIRSINRPDLHQTTIGLFSLALSMYSYHTQWGLTPLLLIGLIPILYRQNSKKTIIACLFFLSLVTPLIARFFTDLQTTARANTELIWRGANLADKLNNSQISLPEKSLIAIKAITENYLEYISPAPLFYNGLGLFERDRLFIQGLWPALFLIFLLSGLASIKYTIHSKYKSFIWWWLLSAPLVPALTQGGFNHVRFLPAVVPASLVIAIGWQELSKKVSVALSRLLSITIISTFVYFLFIYFVHFPIHSGLNYQFGYQQAAQFLSSIDTTDKVIKIDNRFGPDNIYIGVPHLYLAYYTYTDPKELQNRWYDQEGMHFKNFIISNIDWNKESSNDSIIYFTPVYNLPTTKPYKELHSISLPDGSPVFKIITI